MRLTSLDGLPSSVARPGYTPADHGVGIVHLGLGAFHKAHQAAATDAALAAEGGDWRICGVSLRSPDPAAQLGPQNGLFTLIERSAEGSKARVIGSLAQAFCLGPDRAEVLAALTSPATRIVSLTVTEKGYGLSRATGGVDETHPAIAHDLAAPEAPIGVAGLLVWALKARRTAGIPPFTVLCCDNLPENGLLLRSLLVDFARRTAPEMANFIATEVAFPSTMVDRITPAATTETLADAEALTGHHDEAAVETEAFTQWVIEDNFPTGRPAWEAAGAMFVEDVRPFEEMKLRMLNGAHSMLAYSGFLAGHRHVSDVMQDAPLAALVRRHLAAAAATMPALPGVDFAAYAEALCARFANPHLKHQTYQIAMDATEKLPQRILAPCVAALSAGQPLAPFAFALAAWMRYALGQTEAGEAYALRDPREDELRAAVSGVEGSEDIVARLMALPGLFPAPLAESTALRQAIAKKLETMRAQGMAAAIRTEASA
ncbi:mannitol dehydrogenase family protein [Vannielia litorea]|uniref:mannitol dehydrogenase family protein n=1 Tax=Vannielia litorea TaxID=1217970 RepID=UPI001C979E3B|nr:mannitol dehydrogenase family protein [Vannielia litorea]MBY6048975.1 mannitol dehydrogenase family protein [Vannielia litorea]MBY6076389.1 mannitol dehydrogenase family protein [Vannielia litorea]